MTIKTILMCDWCGGSVEIDTSPTLVVPDGWKPFPGHRVKHLCSYCYYTQDVGFFHG